MSDDFEFKPLTEGLGFHKKVIDLKEKEEAPAAPANFQQPVVSPTFHPKTNIPRPAGWEAAMPQASMQEAPQVQRPMQLIAVPASWPAAIFDATMVLGLTLLFSAAVFAVTHIDLSTLVTMFQTDSASQLAMAVLVLSVFEIYSVVCRTFFGKTLGEWAFEYRLGSYAQQQQILYPIRVAWRSLITALTGFIILPLISTIIHRDVAGMLSGTPMFMEKR